MTFRHAHPCERHPARPRRLGTSAIVAALVSALLGACGANAPAPKPTVLPVVHADRSGPLASFTPGNGELGATGDPAAKLDLLRGLGVRNIHIGIQWAVLAPRPQSRRRPAFNASDPSAYPAAGWTIYDKIVRGIAARGMQLTFALIPPAPLWATGTSTATRGHPSELPYWEPSPTEFGQFVRAVGTRYSGHYTPPGASRPLPRLDHWSVWNEPDQGFQLAPQDVPHTAVEASGRQYRGLLDAAWAALHQTGHGGDSILIGEIAPIGSSLGTPGLFGSMAPLRFLRALYCVDAAYKPLVGNAAAQRGCPTTAAGTAGFAAAHPALFQASGFANHPYPQGLAPNTVSPQEPDYTELAATGRLESKLDRLNEIYGSHTRYPIYSTEFGYQTNPPDTENGVVSPQTAAAWMNWAEYITWSDPRQVTFNQYLISDPPGGAFATGLLTAAGTPKPAYDAYRLPLYLPATTTRRGHPLVVWGDVRPAYYAQRQTHRAQHVQIQFAPHGTTSFQTLQTVTIVSSHGFFETSMTFPQSGTVRLAWQYPNRTGIVSRAVVVTLR